MGIQGEHTIVQERRWVVGHSVGYMDFECCPGQDLSVDMTKSRQPRSYTKVGSSTQYPAAS
jgi:hypothetical protein